jgi:hypothetical protein
MTSCASRLAAAEINTQRLACLEDGDLSRALECFRAALAKVKCQVHNGSNTPRTRQKVLPDFISLRQSSSYSTDYSKRYSSKLQQQRYFNGLVHSQGISILVGAPSEAMLSLDSAIVIFNIALVLQLGGGGASGAGAEDYDRQNELFKARLLYEQSYRLLIRAIGGDDRGATGHPILDLLCLAIYCNLARLVKELGNDQGAKLLLSRLFDLALQVESLEVSSSLFMRDYTKHFLRICALSGLVIAPGAGAPAA